MADSFVFSNGAVAALQDAVEQFDTTFYISPDDVDRFPTLSAGAKFAIVLADAEDNFEICYVSALTAEGVMTVERAREATGALSWSAGTQVEHTITAASLLAVGGVNPRGEWSAASTYQPRDMVEQAGISYIATQPSTNQVPSAGSAYWQTFYVPPGVSATALTWAGDWSSSTTYAQGAYAKYNGRLFVSVTAGNQNHLPTDLAWWYPLARSPDATWHQAPLAATGTNNYTVSPSPAPAAYYDGMTVAAIFANANTAVPTLAVGALAPKPIRPRRGVEFGVGDIAANSLFYFTYLAATDELVAIMSPGLERRLAALEAALGTSSYGDIKDTAASVAPAGWLLCYGQAISRSTYAGLFNAIGTAFGAGDGSSTFNVPDCRGRARIGKDNMGGSAANRVTSAISGITGTTLGAAGGSQSMQQHNHTTQAAGTHQHGGSTSASGGHTHPYLRPNSQSNAQSGGGSQSFYYTTTSDQTSEGGDHTHTLLDNAAGSHSHTVDNTGVGTSQNMPPSIVFNTLIFAGV